MLCLRVEFLTGRYVACEFNDRGRAEWPPHPARIFSALVAAHHEFGATEAGAEALRWLETLPPPSLSFSNASRQSVKVNYVPVNDKAISDAATVQNAWRKVLDDTGTAKQRDKARLNLESAYAKVGTRDTKPNKKAAELGRHLLPETRTKQPRYFPSMVPEDPTVWLSWNVEPTDEQRQTLQTIATSITRIGHSSSLVAACVTDTAPPPALVPDREGGTALRWVSKGQLTALQTLHTAAPHAEQRVMPYVVSRYAEAREDRITAGSDFDNRMIILRRADGPQLPITVAEGLANAVRRALIAHAPEPVDSMISGHPPVGGALQGAHLAVVPLANVDHRHADGNILGIGLVHPRTASKAAMKALYQSIRSWEAADEGDTMQLRLGSLGCWQLERCVDLPALKNLRETSWCRPCSTWISVTPVRLDRHPGDWHSSNPARRQAAAAKLRATIARACAHVGLPEPDSLEFSRDPYCRGSQPAGRFLQHTINADDRRPLLHLRITFAQPVRGPVLLGAGRYRGLGWFRPGRSGGMVDDD